MRRWLVLFALVLPTWATAAPGETLKLEIVLIRHGVRSPTSAPEALGKYSTDPWPAWPVAPGVLTDHGAQGMQSLGQLYRERYASRGLWSGDCANASQIRIIADSTPRNRASAMALGKGLGGECSLGYDARPNGENNRLFHAGAHDGDDAGTVASIDFPPAFGQLQGLLLGCTGDACWRRALAQGRKLLIKGDQATALKTAGSLSENLMLEYAQGMPLSSVAWGRADAQAIGELITLHNLQFAVSKKALPAAQQGGSNLLAHIAATLQAVSGQTPEVQSLADGDQRVIVLLGHDTNLAHVAGLLGVDWHDARQPDDYPPGGALIFDLYQQRGRYSIQVHAWMPTLDSLRQARVDATTMIDTRLAFGDCKATDACPLNAFIRWVDSRIARDAVDKATPELVHQRD
ncbi:histidine-type phosphatase [Dyella sp.]|uniref:histidine-type phosphatase n=1 Tax=Dyella sp. TaxID=1869338 RepID=UPI002ED66C8D